MTHPRGIRDIGSAAAGSTMITDVWVSVVAILALAGLLFGVFALICLHIAVYKRERAFDKATTDALRSKVLSAPRPLVALITGANSGIGFEIATQLLKRGITVVLGCRSPSRAQNAVQRLKTITGCTDDEVQLLRIDVSSCSSVRRAAAEFQSRFEQLDLLYCNAGIFPVSGYAWRKVGLPAIFCCRSPRFAATGRDRADGPHFLQQPKTTLTDEGLPLMLATHVVGHWLLAQLLRPQLRAAGDARIIWTASRAASSATFTWASYDAVAEADSIATAAKVFDGEGKGDDSYGAAKFGQDLINRSLAQEFRRDNIACVTACPGFVNTGIGPEFFSRAAPLLWMLRPLYPSMNISTKRGAAVLLHLAILPVQYLTADKKFVTCRGAVQSATYGAPDVDAADVARMRDMCAKLAQLAEERKPDGGWTSS